MSDFNFNEVVIDRVHRIHKYDLNGKRMWTMNQVKDFKLTLGGETVYAQDAQGVNIMAFDKSKTAEADWSNALMHLGALADQMGSKKEVASSEAKQVFTTVEYLTSTDGKKLTLTHTPKTAVANAPFKYIDLIDGQGNALKTFELGETADSQFSVSGTQVTLPTGANLKAGDRFVVKYQYESEEGIAINDSADKFSTEGEFVIEAFCYNPCDKANKKLMRIIFPNAKMDSAIDMTLNNELTHPVKISATQEYCSEDKRLFRIETAAA